MVGERKERCAGGKDGGRQRRKEEKLQATRVGNRVPPPVIGSLPLAAVDGYCLNGGQRQRKEGGGGGR